jgi:hypothetical protein
MGGGMVFFMLAYFFRAFINRRAKPTKQHNLTQGGHYGQSMVENV